VSDSVRIKFRRVSFLWSELSALPTDDRALLAFACFAVSEVNCLRNLTIQSLHQVPENPTAEKYVSIQRNTLVRILVGKLWEFCTAIERKGTKLADLSTKAKAAVTFAADQIVAAGALPGAKVANNLRNKTTFHYDIGQFRKNIRAGVGDFEAGFEITEQDGNCVFRMGEVVANGNDKQVNFEELLAWMQEIARTMTEFHLSLLNGIIPSSLFQSREKEEFIEFPKDLVAFLSDRLPVLMRSP